MAIQTVGSVCFPAFGSEINGTPTFTTTLYTIDAASEKAACVFYVPISGSIVALLFRTETVTNGATVDTRLETASISDGFPTGTLAGNDTNGSQVIGNGDDNVLFRVVLTAAYSATAGDLLAMVIVNPAVSPGNMRIAAPAAQLANVTGQPHGCLFTTSWAMVAAPPIICGIEYSGGVYHEFPNLFPISSIASNSFSTSSSPNHRALRFRLAAPMRSHGFWVACDLDGNADVLLVPDDWDGTDGDALTPKVFLDADVRQSTTARVFKRIWTSPVDLAANTTYRLVIRPQSTTALILYGSSVGDAARWDQMDAGQQFYESTATNPNDPTDWTDTTTNRPMCGLLLNGFDDGAGGSGGTLVHAGMAGGMRG